MIRHYIVVLRQLGKMFTIYIFLPNFLTFCCLFLVVTILEFIYEKAKKQANLSLDSNNENIAKNLKKLIYGYSYFQLFLIYEASCILSFFLPAFVTTI